MNPNILYPHSWNSNQSSIQGIQRIIGNQWDQRNRWLIWAHSIHMSPISTSAHLEDHLEWSFRMCVYCKPVNSTFIGNALFLLLLSAGPDGFSIQRALCASILSLMSLLLLGVIHLFLFSSTLTPSGLVQKRIFMVSYYWRNYCFHKIIISSVTLTNKTKPFSEES